MTAAQKTARANFKKAIAYKQKTGVSLKEAFASVYGKKKVGAVAKKVSVKKVISSNNIKIISGIDNLEKATYTILGVKIGFKKIVDKETNLTYLMIVDLVKNKNIIPVRYNSDTDSITYDLANYIDVYSTNKNKDTLIYKIRPDLKKLVIKLKDAVQKLNKSNKKPVAKKVSVKKPIAKKVTRKVVKKKAAPKKIAKKKLTSRDYDKRFQAQKPGKRTSASGNTYYEYRVNRSDKGKLLGIGNVEDKMFKDLYNVRDKIANTKQAILKLQGYKNQVPFSQKYAYTKKINEYKKYLKEIVTHYRELKKYI